MNTSHSHSDDCNVAKDIANYRRIIKDKTGEITKGGKVKTGEGMEEDMSNIMIRTASITHEGGVTILNRVEAGVIKEGGARITNRKGAGILKEGGARIINRNGRVTGPMVEEVKVTESTTTIKIASRDVMTDIKGKNLSLKCVDLYPS